MLFIKAFSIATLLLLSLSAKEYKAVFDCSSKNFDYLQSRISLIEKTASMIKAKNDTIDFVLLIHSGCTPIATSIAENYVKASDVGFITNIQTKLEALHKNHNVTIKLCKLAMKHADMDEDEVLSFISLTENSFIDAITLQNSHYAMMTFK